MRWCRHAIGARDALIRLAMTSRPYNGSRLESARVRADSVLGRQFDEHVPFSAIDCRLFANKHPVVFDVELDRVHGHPPDPGRTQLLVTWHVYRQLVDNRGEMIKPVEAIHWSGSGFETCLPLSVS